MNFGPLLFSMLLERKWRRDRRLNTEKKQILGVSLLTQPAADKTFQSDLLSFKCRRRRSHRLMMQLKSENREEEEMKMTAN